ncbi:MAG: hypothetical protein EKK37_16465 [Sphingobacteriales bacterium]|nr:MAG: hypothetical protein EKK37_16465 [Sphingobacteriales bacterium]
MRKLLLSSIVLLIFAIALTVFQMSCKKEATAQQTGSNYTLPPATTTTLGGVIVGSGLTVNSSGLLSTTPNANLVQLNTILYLKSGATSVEIWLANTDGTNQRKVPISLAASQVIVPGYGERLSPDGKVVFFTVSENQAYNLYSCSTDGSNLKKIIGNIITLEGVY